MEKFYQPFTSEIFYSDECKVKNHEELRKYVIDLYNESPVKEEGNFYGTGLTTYFYNDFTSHLNSIDVFKEVSEMILQKAEEYLINRAKVIFIETGIDIPIRSKIDEVGLEITSFWFNVNPYGGYQGKHHHAINLLGGTYYLQCPENTGSIGFSNPNQFAYYKNQTKMHEHLTLSDFKVSTIDGDLIIWPGWMDHEISANHNKNENRMTISFGINWKNHVQDI